MRDEQWGGLVDELSELKRKRFQYLHRLYQVTKGNEWAHASMWEIGDQLGLSREETELVTQYLSGENLIEFRYAGGGLAITHWGVMQVEEALSEPEKPTQYFPPVNIINIQQMVQSQIQQGVTHGTQIGAVSSVDIPSVVEFLDVLKRVLSELGLDPGDKQEADAEIATIDAQLRSNRPKSPIIRESLGALKRILEGAAGGVLAAELLRRLGDLL